MNANQQRIKELMLEGLPSSSIAARLPHLRPGTIRTYSTQIRAELTPEEIAQRDAARAERPSSQADVYHRKFSQRPVLGPVHVRIGSQLLAARAETGMNLGDFSRHWGFSNRVTLSAMEQGYHDFTVSEIYQVADIVGISVEDLLRPPSEGKAS